MFQLLNFLRPHHWIKNFLIFVPIITSHQFDIFTIKNTILAFISFSLIASCGYVFNDLLDAKTDKLNTSLLDNKIFTQDEFKIFFIR